MTTPNPDPGPVIKMLSTLRRVHRLSQADVAAAMGTTQSAVSDLEGGRVEPRLSTLVRYAKACGCDVRIIVSATVDLLAAAPEPNGDSSDGL